MADSMPADPDGRLRAQGLPAALGALHRQRDPAARAARPAAAAVRAQARRRGRTATRSSSAIRAPAASTCRRRRRSRRRPLPRWLRRQPRPRSCPALARVPRRRPRGLARAAGLARCARRSRARQGRVGWPRKVYLKELLQAVALADRLLEPGRRRATCTPTSPTARPRSTWLASTITGLPFSFTGHAKDIYSDVAQPGRAAAAQAARPRASRSPAPRPTASTCATLAPARPVHRVYHGLNADFARLARRRAAERASANGSLRVLGVGRLVAEEGLRRAGRGLRRPRAGAGVDARGDDRRRGRRRTRRRAARALVAAPRARGRVRARRAARPGRAARASTARAERLLPALPRASTTATATGSPTCSSRRWPAALPVVTTAVSGIPELVRDGENGLLVPPDDPAAVADALAAAAPTTRRSPRAWRARGRETVPRRFDGDRLRGRLAALFERGDRVSAGARDPAPARPRPVFCVIAHATATSPSPRRSARAASPTRRHARPRPADPDWLGADLPDDEEWRIEWTKFYYGLDLAHAFTRHRRAPLPATPGSGWSRPGSRQVAGRRDTTDVAARRIQNWIYAWQRVRRRARLRRAPAGARARRCSRADRRPGRPTSRDHLTPRAQPPHARALRACSSSRSACPSSTPTARCSPFAIGELAREPRRPTSARRRPPRVLDALPPARAALVRSAARENARRFGLALPAGYDDAARARPATSRCTATARTGTIPALSDGDTGDYRRPARARRRAARPARPALGRHRRRRGRAAAPTLGELPRRRLPRQRSGWGDGAPYADERFLIFDCGPLGDGGHGHYDLLSVEVVAGGRPLVVDPGRYTYAEERPEPGGAGSRARRRTTPSASTGSTRRRTGAASRKGPVAEARFSAAHSAPGLDVLPARRAAPRYDAVHTRARRLRRRRVLARRRPADGAVAAPLRPALPPRAGGAGPGRPAVGRGRHAVVRAPGLALVLAGDGEAALEDGWVSPDYGIKHPAPVVSVVAGAVRSARFVSVLVPLADGAPDPAVAVRRGDGSPRSRSPAPAASSTACAGRPARATCASATPRPRPGGLGAPGGRPAERAAAAADGAGPPGRPPRPAPRRGERAVSVLDARRRAGPRPAAAATRPAARRRGDARPARGRCSARRVARRCERIRVKYRVGESLRVVYRLDRRRPRADRRLPTFRPGLAAAAHAKAPGRGADLGGAARRRARPRARDGLLDVPDDRKLRSLAALDPASGSSPSCSGGARGDRAGRLRAGEVRRRRLPGRARRAVRLRQGLRRRDEAARRPRRARRALARRGRRPPGAAACRAPLARRAATSSRSSRSPGAARGELDGRGGSARRRAASGARRRHASRAARRRTASSRSTRLEPRSAAHAGRRDRPRAGPTSPRRAGAPRAARSRPRRRPTGPDVCLHGDVHLKNACSTGRPGRADRPRPGRARPGGGRPRQPAGRAALRRALAGDAGRAAESRRGALLGGLRGRPRRCPTPDGCAGTSAAALARPSGPCGPSTACGPRGLAAARDVARRRRWPSWRPGREPPRLLFYCQHSLGLGHLARSLALARRAGRATSRRPAQRRRAAREHRACRRASSSSSCRRWAWRTRRRAGQPRTDRPGRGRPATRAASRCSRPLDARAARRRASSSCSRSAAASSPPSSCRCSRRAPRGRRRSSPAACATSSSPRAATRRAHDERAVASPTRSSTPCSCTPTRRFARLEESFRPRTPLRVPVHHTGFVAPRRTAGRRRARRARPRRRLGRRRRASASRCCAPRSRRTGSRSRRGRRDDARRRAVPARRRSGDELQAAARERRGLEVRALGPRPVRRAAPRRRLGQPVRLQHRARLIRVAACRRSSCRSPRAARTSRRAAPARLAPLGAAARCCEPRELDRRALAAELAALLGLAPRARRGSTSTAAPPAPRLLAAPGRPPAAEAPA